MRIDQFLNAVNIVKSRQIAKDMMNNKVVSLNNKVVKGSKIVSTSDEIKITYLDNTRIYKVLSIPASRTTRKSEQSIYIKEVG
jgi:ribosomal 50S subunit-recycling heat shock protein